MCVSLPLTSKRGCESRNKGSSERSLFSGRKVFATELPRDPRTGGQRDIGVLTRKTTTPSTDLHPSRVLRAERNSCVETRMGNTNHVGVPGAPFQVGGEGRGGPGDTTQRRDENTLKDTRGCRVRLVPQGREYPTAEDEYDPSRIYGRGCGTCIKPKVDSTWGKVLRKD